MTKLRVRSIQFRLTASYTAILALTFALIALGVWFALSQSIEETADRELRSRLADVRHYFNSFTAEDLAHLEEEFREEGLLGQAGANIRITDKAGKWLFRTPGTEAWPLDGLNVEGPVDGRTLTIRSGHQSIRLLTAPVRVGYVQIGLPIDEFEEVESGFLWLIGLGAPALLSLAWLGGYWMSGRALKPVDEISAAAARFSALDLSARLPANGSGDELDRLSEVLNGMLTRLESAFLRVTEFTADASHELRTPIAVIQTTAELMQTQERNRDEHARGWARVTTETGRMSRLISDLLTLARADAGKSVFDVGIVDLTALVKAAADEMQVLGENKGLEVVVTPSDSCLVRGDAEAFTRVICILLDNAIKFTAPPGKVMVSVRCQARSEVIVRDTGIGMAPDELAMIFERFYRVSKDRSRATGGTGLGLSIARWIVEQHRGLISVESKPGSGSVFTMSLPKLCDVSTVPTGGED